MAKAKDKDATGPNIGRKVYAVATFWNDDLEARYQVIYGTVTNECGEESYRCFIVNGYLIPVARAFDTVEEARAKRQELIDKRSRQAAESLD